MSNTSISPTKRPPLGIIPTWLHKERRLADIEAAIGRYKQVGVKVPAEWYVELYHLRYEKVEKFAIFLLLFVETAMIVYLLIINK